MEVDDPKPSGVTAEGGIISLLKECRKSGKSVKEFAKTKGIHEATYYNWRNKYVGGKEKRAGFAKLKINPTQTTHRLFCLHK